MNDQCHAEPISQAAFVDEPTDARIIKLMVSGMGCVNCATRVRNHLLRLDGVVSADVDWQSGLTFVDYVPAQTTPDKIVNAVAQAGDGERHRYAAHIFK